MLQEAMIRLTTGDRHNPRVAWPGAVVSGFGDEHTTVLRTVLYGTEQYVSGESGTTMTPAYTK